jgi:hypothetical protein
MGRPKGSRNKRTLLKEAEQRVGAKYVDQVLDSLYVLENAMRHFYIRAEMGNNTGRKKEEVDEDYKQAAALAAMVAPYRHPRLGAMKLAGDQNAPKDLEDGASLDELKKLVEYHLERVAPVFDLKVIPLNGNGTEPEGGGSVSGGARRMPVAKS